MNKIKNNRLFKSFDLNVYDTNNPLNVYTINKDTLLKLFAWISKTFEKSSSCYLKNGSCELKNLFENSEKQQITNGMFKGAMISRGFEVTNNSKNNINFFFNAKYKLGVKQ